MDGESQKAQDERVEKLWISLHSGPVAPLDLGGLREGLRKIDHPLANAEDLLKDILKAVDTSGDGHIDYSEFRAFVEHAENQLWQLFKNIDRDHNGKLDKDELRHAFARAGLVIDNSKLGRFFDEVDTNHDGMITFDEWRNFLLFLPTRTPNLKSVLSYYSSAVKVNPEGDVQVSDEGVQGLGTKTLFLLFFGLIIRIVNARHPPTHHKSQRADIRSTKRTAPDPSKFPWDPGNPHTAAMAENLLDAQDEITEDVHLLTTLLPHPGYFFAGAIAGVVSRTATAPLDRLKVYLIAQTSANKETIDAVKSGAPLQAAKSATQPLYDATLALWRMGGIRSLFAGNGLNVVKVMPESAIKFGSYEGTKRLMARLEGHDNPKSLGPWSQFFSAGMGGVISQFCIYPLDTLKFRMQCETVKGGLRGNKLIVATTKKMLQGNGVRSYYRGLFMGLGGMFPYSAIDLTTYEYLKRLIIARNVRVHRCSEQEALPGGMMTGGIGAFSSSFGASAVYPLNLLRTRLQSQGTVIHPPTYTGWRDCFSRTVKTEGIQGLYKGLTPNLLKVIPSMSISYMVYEASKKFMNLQ